MGDAELHQQIALPTLPSPESSATLRDGKHPHRPFTHWRLPSGPTANVAKRDFALLIAAVDRDDARPFLRHAVFLSSAGTAVYPAARARRRFAGSNCRVSAWPRRMPRARTEMRITRSG